jgi:hypothetical protein
MGRAVLAGTAAPVAMASWAVSGAERPLRRAAVSSGAHLGQPGHVLQDQRQQRPAHERPSPVRPAGSQISTTGTSWNGATRYPGS